jgi:site-specific DNA-methyltransferase (adenine-specific)
MGSGSTLVAACRCNRKGIGIELDEKYCRIALQRIQNEGVA